ncbi:uncharacterized protein LOC117641555 [Thrips palmi]|uniref:Uncharacterized protein LOC117641555 n=1 Tax=Thrips palmi TaxID=161013 RepID=A0A6P8YLL0_THRPL|nr:uncharacterized protein LOC117641555 [Thrips palmi]
MKSVLVALVVLATLLAASKAGPAAAQRKLKPLAEVLKSDRAPTAEDAAVVAAAAVPVESRKVVGCYEPGCNYQCQRYQYAGGYCSWGECLCWY